MQGLFDIKKPRLFHALGGEQRFQYAVHARFKARDVHGDDHARPVADGRVLHDGKDVDM